MQCVGDVGDVGGLEVRVGGRCGRVGDATESGIHNSRKTPTADDLHQNFPRESSTTFEAFFPRARRTKISRRNVKTFTAADNISHIFICQSNYFASGPNIVYVSKNNFQKMSSYFLNIRKSLKYDHSWTLRNFCQH